MRTAAYLNLLGIAVALLACDTADIVDYTSATSSTSNNGGSPVVPAGLVDVDEDKIDADNPYAFVIMKKPEGLQEFGIDGFCPTTETFACRRLPHDDYAGLKGYIVSPEPEDSYLGYDFYRAVLENGQWFYLTHRRQPGDIFSRSRSVIRLSELSKHLDRVEQPVVPGSNLKIASTRQEGTWLYTTLSNGVEFRDDQLSAFQQIAEWIPEDRRAKVAELASAFHLEIDEVEKRVLLRRKGRDLGPLYTRMIVTREGATLRMIVRYNADNWLFVERYTLAVGDERFQQRADFRRDNAGGRVWEWIDISPTPEQMSLLRQVAASDDATLRFYGRDYYRDQDIDREARRDLTKMLELYRILS